MSLLFLPRSTRVAAGFLFFWLCLLNASAQDSTLAMNDNKSPYPLNDPRNPDCPCHRYQQQAEEEYRQLMNPENKAEDSVHTETVSSANPPLKSPPERISATPKISSSVRKRHSIGHSTRRHTARPRRSPKRQGKLAACFHW